MSRRAPRSRNRPGRWPAVALPLALLLAALAVLAPVPLRAQGELDTLRAVEARRYRAMVQGDVETLRQVLHDDLVYTHSHGGVDGKEELLAALADGGVVYEKIELAGQEVRLLGTAAAVVTGRATLHVTAGGERHVVPVRFTAVYSREGGEPWRLVAWQSTEIAGG